MNIIVKNKNVLPTDQATLFEDEPVVFVEEGTKYPNMLVELGLMPSTSQARRNGRVGDIPSGWNVVKGNRKVVLYIWNPTE